MSQGFGTPPQSAQSGSAPAIVTWDGTGSEPARPSATYVWWFAPSQPAGMLAGDVWTDNS